MSRLHIEQSYIGQMAIHLDNFIWVSTARYANFKCPVCGDSQTNQHRRRGYIFVHQKSRDFYVVKCHNCGYNSSFLNFLKDYFPSVYTSMKMELFKSNMPNREVPTLPEIEVIEEPKFAITDNTTEKICIKDLPNFHHAKKYCIERLIPEDKLRNIFFTKDFKKYIESVCPGKYPKLPENDERIVFEFRDLDGKLTGAQGRVLKKTAKNRFITLKFDADSHKIYGIEHINKTLPVLVTEGVIDSFFLDNSIAQTGGDVIPNLDEVLGVPKSQIYIVLDNEPRSKDTVNRMEVAIRCGYNVHFWNVDSSLKDINDMIKSGISKNDIMRSIIDNSFSGFKAKSKFSQWKKI